MGPCERAPKAMEGGVSGTQGHTDLPCGGQNTQAQCHSGFHCHKVRKQKSLGSWPRNPPTPWGMEAILPEDVTG